MVHFVQQLIVAVLLLQAVSLNLTSAKFQSLLRTPLQPFPLARASNSQSQGECMRQVWE